MGRSRVRRDLGRVDFATGGASERSTFDNAVVSYNGDRVLHFHHPNWRMDRNDPATEVRPPRA